MSCQHPNCSNSIHSICIIHCGWSLCEEHINEHKKFLLSQFEEVLQDIIKPTNKLSKSIKQTKQISNEYQQKEFDHIEQNHKNQINNIEQQLIKVNKFQEQSNEISKNLIKIKNNQHILTQNHFQEIDILSKELNQYKNSIIEPIEEKNLVTIEHSSLSSKEFLQNKKSDRIICPLTSINIYGLLSSHNLRLCSGNKKIRYLFEHFRNYHHLKINYASQLMKAVTLNLDPMITKIFPSDKNLIIADNTQACPLHNIPCESKIRCTPCTSILTDKFVRIHLKNVHRLSPSRIETILKKNLIRIKK